jgi:hypothetical protein
MDKARKFLGTVCQRIFLSAFTDSFLQDRKKRQFKRKKLLSIRIGFNANQDPAFKLNAGPNSDPGTKPIWIRADPDPVKTVALQKFDC